MSADGVLTVAIAGRPLTLLPEKAIWLAEAATLLVADAHVGKAVSFRSLGVPVPRGTTSETLGLLSALVVRHAAQRIIFLGDFLHSARSHATATLATLSAWRNAHAGLQLTLIRGNHDDRAGDPPAGLHFEVVDEPLPFAGWLLCHHPTPRAEGYVLAGHTHPCVVMRGRARDRLRLPCFHFGPTVGVLPAFGSFTGMFPVAATVDDQVFAVTPEQVTAVPRLTAY